MEEELRNIIVEFNSAQEKAVDILEVDFECPRPKNTMDYITRCIPLIREKEYKANGTHIRPHGIGMEITFQGISIDFDFGENGEINGFDAWRLFNFVRANNVSISFKSEEEIEAAIKSAICSGTIVKSKCMGNNHYVNS